MSKKTRFCWTIILLSAGVGSVAEQIPANADSPPMRSVIAGRADKVSELDATLKDARCNLEKIGEGFFAPNAHSVTVDNRTHSAYFPLHDAGGQPILKIALHSD